MTLGGWITMIGSIGFVTTLFGWCVYRLLRGPTDPDRMARVEPVTEQESAEELR